MKLRLAVLTIGTELLNGDLADTNTACLGRILGREGYAIREAMTVADIEPDIQEALLELAGKRDVVIVTGGLGPTGDDLTARVAARTFKRRLILNEEALAQIRGHFERLGREMHPANEKQALLPQKAEILPNPKGSAPGFHMLHNGRHLFFLPGVPDEMRTMASESVLPRLHELSGGRPPVEERRLSVFGLSEAKVQALLEKAGVGEGVRLAFGVDFPLVQVKLSSSGEEAGSAIDRAELTARRTLGDYVVATGEETLGGTVARLLEDTGMTLATAESCTGGLIAKTLTDIPGSSAYFLRGAVTYSDPAKEQWLEVEPELLQRYGAVSEACARAMAQGMRRAAGSDLAVAVTGIAGPGGGTAQKPVGTVFIALDSGEGTSARGYRFHGDRCQVRSISCCMALDWVRRHLLRHLEQTG